MIDYDFSPMRSLAICWRHKWKSALLAVTAMALAIGSLFVLSPRFVAEGKVLVRLGRENSTFDPTATMGQQPVVAAPTTREEEINSVVEICNSRWLLEQVVDELGPEAILGDAAKSDGVLSAVRRQLQAWDVADDLPPRERAVERLMKRLSVAAIRRSNVLLVSYEADSPEAAQAVVASLLDHFVAHYGKVQRPPKSGEFFADRVAAAQSELEAADSALRELETETGLADHAEQLKLLVARLDSVEAELSRAQVEQGAAQAEVTALEQRLADLPQTIVRETETGYPHAATDGMQVEFFRLQAREAELASKFTDANPELQRVRAQLVEIESRLIDQPPSRTQETTAVNAAWEELHLALLRRQAELAAITSRVDLLAQHASAARERLSVHTSDAVRIVQAERTRTLAEDRFEQYSAALAQVRIDEGLESEKITNLAVVQPALARGRRVSPRLTVHLGLGVAAAMLGGIGMAFGAEYLGRSVRNEQDLRSLLGVETLVSVPRLRASDVHLEPSLVGRDHV